MGAYVVKPSLQEKLKITYYTGWRHHFHPFKLYIIF